MAHHWFIIHHWPLIGWGLEENECFDFDLIVTGGRPERVMTSLVCHIEHHHKPISLAVEVSFKVWKNHVISIYIYIFFLYIFHKCVVAVRFFNVVFYFFMLLIWFWVGSCCDHQCAQCGLWAPEGRGAGTSLAAPHQYHPASGLLDTKGEAGGQRDTGTLWVDWYSRLVSCLCSFLSLWISIAQILIQPCRGVLPPLASCHVDVLFVPRFCQQYQTELQLAVEDGTGWYESIKLNPKTPSFS